MAIKTLHLTNAFHSHSGGIATFYQAMLHAANQQRREMRLIVPGAESHVEELGDYGDDACDDSHFCSTLF